MLLTPLEQHGASNQVPLPLLAHGCSIQRIHMTQLYVLIMAAN